MAAGMAVAAVTMAAGMAVAAVMVAMAVTVAAASAFGGVAAEAAEVAEVAEAMAAIGAGLTACGRGVLTTTTPTSLWTAPRWRNE
jgi:hypothetical protein